MPEFAWRDWVKRRTLSVTTWRPAVPHYAVWPAVGGVGLCRSCPQSSAYFSCWDAHNLNLTLLRPVFCSLTSFLHARSAVELRFCTSLHWLSSLRMWAVLLSIPLLTFYRFLRLANPSFELRQTYFLSGSKFAFKELKFHLYSVPAYQVILPVPYTCDRWQQFRIQTVVTQESKGIYVSVDITASNFAGKNLSVDSRSAYSTNCFSRTPALSPISRF